jgi:enamine deaminase RidA (YjgF/YER057c/UK114 family)
MQQRQNIVTGAPWESIVGYSRAVRIGNIIEVSGTTSVDGQTFVGENDMYQQTYFILQKIEKAIIDAGGSLQDVVRTRIYVTRIDLWAEVARAHAEFFRQIMPCTTMVEVKALIDPRMWVEIEATAIRS